jgi:hypothetical protein
MNEFEAKRMLQDAAARRALWEMLWKAAHVHEVGRPIPSSSDDEIKKELERILLPKRKKFLGLF